MSSSDESDYGESMLEMMESEDLEFLKNAVQNKSYSVLNKVKCLRKKTKKNKKESLDLEDKYEIENDNDEPKTKILLPIKSKKGIILRTVECSDEEERDDTDNQENGDKENKSDDFNEDMDNYEFETDEISKEINNPIDVLAKYNESLRNKKVHIGYMCSGLLENPEDKIGNFRVLFKMLEEESNDAKLAIKKLIFVSLLEVFKDILPSYQIQQQEITKDVKLKKDTLKLHKMETTLLQYYKKYLQLLEKYSKILIVKGKNQKNEEDIKIGEVCINALCELLITHPYFNYSSNIAQTTIPFLNCNNINAREAVGNAYRTTFKQDKKDELTLKIVRGINAFIKNKAHNIRPDMLEVLLHLRIKNANLDQEKEIDMKEKKLSSYKQNVLRLSKKERKRKKRLQELEKEMLEVKAQENKQNKTKNITEIVKVVFGIYFRILKSSENNKILGMCLEGLAKFSHCINLEYYMDLLNILDSLLKEDWLTYRDRLNCVQTVFTILSNQDDIINIDPSRFYISLYKSILNVHASKTHNDTEILLKTTAEAIIKRRKRITNKQLIGFLKRLCTLSLQLLHNGTLGSLGIVKQALQLNRFTDVLLDVDQTVGDGDYQPFLEDPEYCNASSTALYEMTLLRNHYHPIVGKFAKHISSGSPATGEGSLPPEYGKMNQEHLFENFDMNEMAFNPSIPIPKKGTSKLKRKREMFVDEDFEDYCKKVAKMARGCIFLK
ncbi:nucleolar complex protein 3 [Onthophagus taurus]|uniref:nucleolar complex protein 3 n=1 Tax=Onthophagus taurus TaxID=166361 RepID=UPI0039BE33B6